MKWKDYFKNLKMKKNKEKDKEKNREHGTKSTRGGALEGEHGILCRKVSSEYGDGFVVSREDTRVCDCARRYMYNI